MIAYQNNSKNTQELALIYEVTRTFNAHKDLNELFDAIYQLLNNSFALQDISLWIFNSDNATFKSIFNKNYSFEASFFDKLHLKDKFNLENENNKLNFFFINELFISMDNLNLSDLKLDSDNNNLIFPMVNENKLIGLICFTDPKEIKEYITLEILTIMAIISTQLSTAFVNEQLKKQISINASISNATKDIAKIIENQYELNYVIPIMGEIMDKYLYNALVYIFMREKNGKFKLFWPSSYSQKSIDPLLESLDDKVDYVYSDNKYAVAMPLMHNEELIGAVVGDAKIEEIETIEVKFLRDLVNQCSVTLDRSSKYAETVKYATIDALTGLDNRRQLDKRLLQEASVVIRTGRPLSLLMMDIDHFKTINDTHGHSVGDHVLKEVAKIIKSASREYDIAARYGGEEFVLLLPDTPIDGAQILAERLRHNVEEAKFHIGKYVSSKAELIKLTLSVGISSFDSSYKNPADVYEEADIALYKAKQEGRNKVVLFNG